MQSKFVGKRKSRGFSFIRGERDHHFYINYKYGTSL